MEHKIDTLISGNQNTDVFLCNMDFCICELSPAIQRHFPSIHMGEPLEKAFPITIDKKAFLLKLQDGLPILLNCSSSPIDHSGILLFAVPENHKITSIIGFWMSESGSAQLPQSTNAFLVNISDRYRSPISNLLNILSTLALKYQTSEDYKGLDYINEAAQYCYEMLRVSTMIHDYRQLVNNTMDFKPSRQILNDLITDACYHLRTIFRNTEYRLNINITEKPILADVDSKLITRAIYHLISNACTFSPHDSMITVSLSLQNGAAVVSVSDEGIGIAPQDMERIFLPFYSKCDVPAPEEDLGMGLGLPIVKGIVALHHGTVFITSEQNKGTTVSIRLPLDQNNTNILNFESDRTQYTTGKFSDLYVIFSRIGNIKFY